MTVEDVNKKNVLVGIRFDGHTRELLDWALLKVADPGDRVTALHICRNSGTALFPANFFFIDSIVTFISCI